MERYKISLNIISCVFFVFFLIIFVSLIKLQILQAPLDLRKSEIVEPKRGKILDRNLREMAITIEAYSVYKEKAVSNPYKVAKQLSLILEINFTKIHKRLKSNRNYILIARNVSPQKIQACEKLKNPNLKFIKESKGKRVYPKGNLAGHIIGFVNIDRDGLEGVELAFDSVMKGKPGKILTQKDAMGRQLLSKDSKVIPSKNGMDVILTIDEFIQHIAEQELEKVYFERKALGGSIIVMNPHTGEILAMANVPQFDPNEYRKYEKSSLRNRAVTDTFEPGSTMKIFTAIAGFEERVITRDEILNCEKKSLIVGGHVLRDSKEHHKMSFQEVMAVSSNIGVVRVALRLGKEKIYKYFKKFGFGEKSDVNLPGEVNGKLIKPEYWSGTSISSIPIGQEVSVTAIQLARAISIVANGGYKVKPYIIKEIHDSSGKVIQQTKPQIGEKIISDYALKEINMVLENVVEEGTCKRSKMDDYTSGAKTGTAQKFISGKGGYSSGETVLTFVGYAPTTAPKLAIIVILDRPYEQVWADNALGPVFKSVVQRSLHYLNVVPDRQEIVEDKTLKNNENSIVEKEYNYPEDAMPRVLGLTIRKTLDVLTSSDLDVKIVGSGTAVKQVPLPGTKVDKGSTCIVYFAQR